MAAEEDVGEKAKFGSELKLRGVRVKLVDEELEVLQEFDGKLDLECTRAGKTCKVCFCKGEWSNVFSVVFNRASDFLGVSEITKSTVLGG